MTIAQEQLMNLLSHALFSAPTSIIVSSEIMEEAKAQAVSTLIATDYRTISSNIRVINAHAELTNILADIPFSTFKGYASAYYYPEPVKRPMGDVDFIVEQEYYNKAEKLLEVAGWKRIKATHERHDSFKKGKVVLELHKEYKGIPNGVDGIITDSKISEEKVRVFLSDTIATSKSVQTQQGPVIIPDNFHHGLVMLLHVAGHMINDGGIGLRHLCDWAVYVYHVDFESYRKKLESVGLWTFACQLTAVASAYLGLPKQSWTGEWNESFLRSIIEDILAAGNLGRKENGRGVGNRTFQRSSVVSNITEMTMARYPRMAQYRILIPLGCCMSIMQYFWSRIRKKKKWIKVETILSGKKRISLYRNFKLFEVEAGEE